MNVTQEIMFYYKSSPVTAKIFDRHLQVRFVSVKANKTVRSILTSNKTNLVTGHLILVYCLEGLGNTGKVVYKMIMSN